MAEIICRMKPYIQPFERILAHRELEAVAGVAPQPTGSGDEFVYSVDTRKPLSFIIEKLTYWESARKAPGKDLLTLQVKRESTASLVRNGFKLSQIIDCMNDDVILQPPNRRVLRYASHGVHEYRGKFFPQLVRSILNIAGINKRSVILDPMCGSGTTPVESVIHGAQAIGFDMNPLSVLMARSKCDILSIEPDILLSEYERLKDLVLDFENRAKARSRQYINSLPQKSIEYILNWFSSSVLDELDYITACIHTVGHATCKDMFLISLSNILRKVSWQKTDDLRVRRDVRNDIDIDVIAEFISELSRAIKLVLPFLYQNGGFATGSASIEEGDARDVHSILKQKRNKIDLVITSPPYATALPYLDTDRLSLYYLNLLSRPKHRQRDLEMIGNREITNGARSKYYNKYISQADQFPQSITETIITIEKRNKKYGAGFRRQNLPALLGKYFLDMRSVFCSMMEMLKPNSSAYVVIGNNHTVAGGERIEIKTDEYLAQLGESIGLAVENTLSMEMLVSRDIFRKNTGTAETIVHFKKS